MLLRKFWLIYFRSPHYSEWAASALAGVKRLRQLSMRGALGGVAALLLSVSPQLAASVVGRTPARTCLKVPGRPAGR